MEETFDYYREDDDMQISRICAVYFSPCGNVRKIISNMAEYAAKKQNVFVETCDFTLPAAREKEFVFDGKDLVFFGTPVYAGRVPNKIMPYIKEAFFGNGAIAVPVAVFGNRNFDDALVELRNLLEENSFHTIAGAAIVSRHSFSDVIAPERPDETDLEDIQGFVDQVLDKVEAAAAKEEILSVEVPGTNPPDKYYVPLGIDGQPAKFLKARPKTKAEKCDHCGICAENCPMGSIDRQNPEMVTGLCIKCQACIRKCPSKAKYFDDEAFLSHKQMLEKNYIRRTESGFFV